MIDFDKEEFLARLDLRIFTIANMLGYHESWIVSMFEGLGSKHSQVKNMRESIDNAVKTFTNHIGNHDKEIKEYFDKLREKYKND
jgi:hemerythrin